MNSLGKPLDFKFNLGDKLEDKMTGFEGVVVYRTQWITNCNVYGLQSTGLDKDGKPKDRHQFDEPMLELIEEKVIKEDRETGGPNDSPVESNRL